MGRHSIPFERLKETHLTLWPKWIKGSLLKSPALVALLVYSQRPGPSASLPSAVTL